MKSILTKTPISHFIITFVSPFILAMKDYYEIFEKLKTNTDMDILKLIQLIALPFFFLGVFIYFDRKFKAISKDLRKQSKLLREDSAEIDMYLSTVQNRKMEYLYNCLKTNTILPEPKEWLTSEEERLHSDNSEKRQKLLDSINERLDKK